MGATRGTYAVGFAPRDFSPRYPQLWKGCVFAGAPCLGPSGVTLRDWSGNKSHGTLTNTTLSSVWAPSSGSYALVLDGTDDYVNLGSPSNLIMTGNMSLSMWFKTNGDYTTHQSLISSFDSSGGNSCYATTIGLTDNKLEWWQNDTGPSLASTVSISTDAWRHVVFTRAGTTGSWTLNLYVNGVLDKTVSTATNPGTGVSNGVCIGRLGLFNSYFLNGSIDDARIYSRALLPHEITLLAHRRGVAYEYERTPRLETYMKAAGNRVSVFYY